MTLCRLPQFLLIGGENDAAFGDHSALIKVAYFGEPVPRVFKVFVAFREVILARVHCVVAFPEVFFGEQLEK